MADDTYYSRALPILEAVAEAEGRVDYLESMNLAAQIGIDHDAAVVELKRLMQDGLLSGNWTDVGSGAMITVPALASDGARAVGRWPSKDPYEALVALLERRIAEASDEPTRSKWQKMRDTITGLGADVGTNLFASVLFELAKTVT